MKDLAMLYSASLVSKTGRVIKDHIYIGVTNDLVRRESEHNKMCNSKSVSPGIMNLHKQYPNARVVLEPLLSRKMSRNTCLDGEAYLVDWYQPICNRQCSTNRVSNFVNKSFNLMFKNMSKVSPKVVKEIMVK